MLRRMLFLFNIHAGTSGIRTKAADIIDIFVKGGYDVMARSTQSPTDMENIIRERGMEFDTIVICGGDGSLNDAINGLMSLQEPPSLGYIPTGTMNDFAASHHISHKMLQAAEDIVNGDITYTDIGCFNGRYFSYVAAFGIFTDVSYDTSQTSKNLLGKGAYIFEGIKRFPTYSSHHMKIKSGDIVLEGDYVYGMVCNATSVGGFNLGRLSDVSMDDGLMELILVKKGILGLNASVMLGALIQGIDDNPDVEYIRTSEAMIYSEEGVSWTLDGEYGGTVCQSHITCVPRKLKIYVPSHLHRSNSQYMKMQRHITGEEE